MSNIQTCIGVVFGGASGEHDISIRSAKTVINALQAGINAEVFQVICIYIDYEGRWWPSDIAIKALEKGFGLKEHELPFPNASKGFKGFPKGTEGVDIWYPVLHGPNGEDGTIQGLFTLMGKPFVGSGVLGSALGMDKIAMKAAFTAAGLPQAPYISSQAKEVNCSKLRPLLIQRIENKIQYPCFVKPANLGSSVGITKTYDRKELETALKLACSFDQRIVIEKNVPARELECAIIGKGQMKASVVGEIQHQSDWYDYKTKYSSNLSKTLIPANLTRNISETIRKLSLKACEAISAHSIARVDFFYNESKNEVLINEINTMPGFTGESIYPMLWAASGLNIEELVAQLVKTARE